MVASIHSRKITIDSDRILELYSAGLTQTAIATEVGRSKGTVWNVLRKAGVEKGYNFNWLKELTPCQTSVLLGTLMGDGALLKPERYQNAWLQLKHGLKQQDWIFWKFNELRVLFTHEPRQIEEESHGNNHKKWYVSSRCHPVLTDIWRDFYCRNIAECNPHIFHKRVTKSILNRLDDLALAVWFMDDGFRYSVHGTGLALGGLTETEYSLVSDWFNEKGMTNRWGRSQSGDNSARLIFLNEGATRLCERIGREIPGFLWYKLGQPATQERGS